MVKDALIRVILSDGREFIVPFLRKRAIHCSDASYPVAYSRMYTYHCFHVGRRWINVTTKVVVNIDKLFLLCCSQAILTVAPRDDCGKNDWHKCMEPGHDGDIQCYNVLVHSFYTKSYASVGPRPNGRGQVASVRSGAETNCISDSSCSLDQLAHHG